MSTSESKASRAKVHLAAPDRLIWVVVVAIVCWGVWAFGSELILNFRLNHEVQALRDQNTQLAQSNAQTRLEMAAAGSPGALEEAARKEGYAKPGEQVYVIVRPSSSAVPYAGSGPSGAPPTASRQSTRRQDGGVIGAIENWWRNLWH